MIFGFYNEIPKWDFVPEVLFLVFTYFDFKIRSVHIYWLDFLLEEMTKIFCNFLRVEVFRKQVLIFCFWNLEKSTMTKNY